MQEFSHSSYLNISYEETSLLHVTSSVTGVPHRLASLHCRSFIGIRILNRCTSYYYSIKSFESKWTTNLVVNMAVNPDLVPQLVGRYFPNDTTNLRRVGDTQEYLRQSVEYILQGCPPKLPFASLDARGDCYRGLFLGPTALAYFFLLLSEKEPKLTIDGKTPREWTHAYLALGQDNIAPLLNTSCGVTNEYLAYNTVLACANNDVQRALKVTSALQNVDTDPSWVEWLKGRAGGLYLLRAIRKFLPQCTKDVNRVIRILCDAILAQDPWVWTEREYCGTVHGTIGVLTQVILSDASYAPRLESKLVALLDLQADNGNWPVVPSRDLGLVHFCHGAPGFVVSLLAIREFFPALQERIDGAVEKGRSLIWERGLLRKEPNICHGIVGNALALTGAQRGHFLEHATPTDVARGIAEATFVKEEGGRFELLWGAAGRAWVWMDWEIDGGRVVLYTDV